MVIYLILINCDICSVANGNYCTAKDQIQTVGVPLAHNHEVNAMPAVAAHLETVNLNGSVPETQKVGQEEKVPEPTVKAEELTLENGAPKDMAEEKPAQGRFLDSEDYN